MLGPGLGRILAEVMRKGRAEAGPYGFILEQLSPYRTFEGAELLK